eukprot:5650101-Alexandrium_andersonii.AAC.1
MPRATPKQQAAPPSSRAVTQPPPGPTINNIDCSSKAAARAALTDSSCTEWSPAAGPSSTWQQN